MEVTKRRVSRCAWRDATLVVRLAVLVVALVASTPDVETEIAELAEAEAPGTVFRDTVGPGMQGVQDKMEPDGELGEGDSGVSLMNAMVTPNDLGAATGSQRFASDEEQTRIELARVQRGISEAYKDYQGARKMKVALDAAESEEQKAKIHAAQGGITVNQSIAQDTTTASSDERPKGGFVIDDDEPWNVKLMFPNGTTKPHPSIVDPERTSNERTHKEIANAVLTMDRTEANKLKKTASQDVQMQIDTREAHIQDMEKLENITTKLKSEQTAVREGVRVTSKELEFKAKKQEEARELEAKAIQDKKKGGEKSVKMTQRAEAEKESASKSKESSVKINKRGDLEAVRDKANIIITRKPPPEQKQIPGAPDGPPLYANSSKSHFDAISKLTVDSLVNNPDFQGWVYSNTHDDLVTAESLRKQAYEEWQAHQRIAAELQEETTMITERLMERAHALVALTTSSWKAQESGHRKFEEQAQISINNWKKDLETLHNDEVVCDRPECDEDSWKIWVKLEKLLQMVTKSQKRFSQWSGLMHLEVNEGTQNFRAEIEQRMWAQLYEAKDDLFRTLPTNAQQSDMVMAMSTLYEDRVADELRAQQASMLMSNFPIPDTATLPFIINGTRVDQTVVTKTWAACQCEMVFQDGEMKCPYCDRYLWDPSEIYQKYGEESVRTDFDLQRLKWGVLPRENPVVCDIEQTLSVDALQCIYKCSWVNFYGSNWFQKQKDTQCRERFPEGPEREQCVYTYITLPLKYGENIRGAACEAQMSLQAILEKQFLLIDAPGPDEEEPSDKEQTSVELGEEQSIKTPSANIDKARVARGGLTDADRVVPSGAKAASKERELKSAAQAAHEETQAQRKLNEAARSDLANMKAAQSVQGQESSGRARSDEKTEKDATAKTVATARKQEASVNKLWKNDMNPKNVWTGWNCHRRSAEGLVNSYECSFLDPAVGFIGVKSFTRLAGSTVGASSGVCVAWKRVKEESRGICSCCPNFKCERNCEATYDLEGRKRYDDRAMEVCNSKSKKSGIDLTACMRKSLNTVKRIPGRSDNVEKELILPPPKKDTDSGEKLKPLPVWNELRTVFGPNYQTTNKARHWYCKNMWKYSAVDYSNLTRLTAPHTGYCRPDHDDADVHSKVQSTTYNVQCQKSTAHHYIVSKVPYQNSDVQFVYLSDSSKRVRPPGVLWPPQSPPPTTWPSALIAPDMQPSRFSFCSGCCNQLYPKEKGCPKVGKVLSDGAKYLYNDNVKIETLNEAGTFEWELKGEDFSTENGPEEINAFMKSISDIDGRASSDPGADDDDQGGDNKDGDNSVALASDLRKSVLEKLQLRLLETEETAQQASSHDKADGPLEDALSLVSVEEEDPGVTGDEFTPGFTWANSPWGKPRRRRRRRWVFPRRRRRYFNSPVERAAKTARSRATDAVEATQKVLNRHTKDYGELKEEKVENLLMNSAKEQKTALARRTEALNAAKAKKLPQKESDELAEKAFEGVKMDFKQKANDIESKYRNQFKNTEERIAKARMNNDMMVGKQKQVLVDTEQVRYQNEIKARQWSIDAEKATADLAKKFQKLSKKSENRYEVIGYLRQKVAKLETKAKKSEAVVEDAEYKVNKMAYEIKLIKGKADSGKRINAEDMSDISKAAAAKIEDRTKAATKEVQKSLNKGWNDVVTQTQIEFTVPDGAKYNPVVHVKASIYDLQQEMVKSLRKKYFQGQCTAKALDAYYRLLVDKEKGYTNSRGQSFKSPKCERLRSIRERCDSDYTKVCTTVTRQTAVLDAETKYECTKYANLAESVELQKYVFCPRLSNALLSGPANATSCQLVKTCRSAEPKLHEIPPRNCLAWQEML